MRYSLISIFLFTALPLHAQDLNEALEQATKAALKKISPSVVQIVTTGGSDIITTTAKGTFRKALGPTTGLVIEDGFIISSAFNFINKPTNIVVHIPGRTEPVNAQVVATDHSRLLVLLKVDAKGLKVPAFVPKSQVTEGQWSLAVGRSLDTKRDAMPQVSLGVISAKNRIWGKAVQTDAKISPVNYGGPIMDIEGKVQGVLIPASPQGDDVSAGFEWYDSGIGFAIPMDDILAVLPTLKKGKDLHRGLLGIRMKSTDKYEAAVEISEVQRDSAAAKAGLKAGDVIIDIDGHAIGSQSQMQHVLGPKYEGDKITVKYKRGADVLEIKNLTLIGSQSIAGHPFLGILPMRDDPKLGMDIRHVFTDSAAAKAGLKVGDRIMKFGSTKAKKLEDFTGDKPGRVQFTEWLNTQFPGDEIEIEIKRGDKTEKIKVELDSLPGVAKDQEWKLTEKLPAVSSLEKALEPLEMKNAKAPKIDPNPNPVKPKLGWDKIRSADGENTYWFYVPGTYRPEVSHGLVVWLNPPGKFKEKDIEDILDLWNDVLKEKNLIMVFPLSENENGWIASQADFVVETIQESIKRYTVDRGRIVTHGQGVGGQMALHVAFANRDLIRGVAMHSTIVEQAKELQVNQRLAFYISAGDLDPSQKSIAESKEKLQDKKYSVTYKSQANKGREYIDVSAIVEIAAWIDTLDKQ